MNEMISNEQYSQTALTVQTQVLEKTNTSATSIARRTHDDSGYRLTISRLKLLVMVGFMATALVSCDESTEQKAENVENAKTDLADAKEDLKQARADSSAEYAKYKADSELRLKEYDKSIADIKAQTKNAKKEMRNAYEKELAAVDKKNAELRAELNAYTYKETTQEKWEAFTTKINRSIDTLGQSISKMAKDNLKKK